MTYNMKPVGMIDVTSVPLDALVRAAYAPSRQQGLGHLDLTGRVLSLPDDDVTAILERSKDDPLMAISIDYHRGRSVKFNVRKVGDRRYINNQWYDHSDDALRALLQSVGLDGDLIEKARAERAEYDEACLAAALSFLKDAGGSVKQHRWDEKEGTPIPDNVDAGFWIGRDRGLISEDYQKNGITIWGLTGLSS